MASVAACTECHGTGTVEFTKERGGPVCNHCAGNGWLTPEVLTQYFATMLDHPSIYMGGPSMANLNKAKHLVEFLVNEGIIPEASVVEDK